MTATPDGINFADLQAFADQARAREEAEAKEAEDRDPTKAEILAAAREAIELAQEKIGDPIVHKIIVLEILENMISWHTEVGLKCAKDGEERASVCWLRDAGKFQAMMATILGIGLGPLDYTIDENN